MAKGIKPLSFEKLQLIEVTLRMLLEEENPSRAGITEVVYPVFTPDNQEKAAMQLQQFLNQQS